MDTASKPQYDQEFELLLQPRNNGKILSSPTQVWNEGYPHIKEIDSRLRGNDSLSANCFRNKMFVKKLRIQRVKI